MKRVLAVGLSFTGGAIPKGVEVETLGLCRAETDDTKSAYSLYEYDVIIINPESYTHFLFGKAGKFSGSKDELFDLKRLNNKYDLDSAFDQVDRGNELDAALRGGSRVIWCLTDDERTHFFGYRTRHIAYLNEKVRNFVTRSSLAIKKSRRIDVIDPDNPFPRFMSEVQKSGWRECLTDPRDNFESVVDTPEGYSLAGRIDLGRSSGWIVTSPRSQDAVNALILDCISMPAKSAKSEKYHGIFMSHTHDDKPMVRRLRKDLMDRGVPRVWVDEAEIQVGDSLIAKIEEGMKDTRYFGVLLSKASVKAQWVKKELDVAMNKEIAGGQPVVLPLLYEKCDIPAFLTGKLYADFTTPTSYDTALEKLLRRLRIK